MVNGLFYVYFYIFNFYNLEYSDIVFDPPNKFVSNNEQSSDQLKIETSVKSQSDLGRQLVQTLQYSHIEQYSTKKTDKKMEVMHSESETRWLKFAELMARYE